MSYLNKKEYLRELSDELRGYFKKKDVKNIIADYEEFFSAGISDGKSEIEICVEFGNAKELAREIAANQTDAKRRIIKEKYINHIIICIIAACIVFLYWVPDYRTFARGIYIPDLLWHLYIIAAPSLILIFVKLYKKYDIKLDAVILIILFLFVCIPAVRDIINILKFDSPGMTWILWSWSVIIFTRPLLILIITLVIILTLREEKPDYINFAPMIFILTGLYRTINRLLSILGDMGDPIDSIIAIVNSFLPLFIGLSIAAVIYLFSFWRKYLPKFKKQEARDK